MKPAAEVAAEAWGADPKYIDRMVSTLECSPADVADTFSCEMRFNDVSTAEWPIVKLDGDRTYVGDTCFIMTFANGEEGELSRDCKRLPDHVGGPAE